MYGVESSFLLALLLIVAIFLVMLAVFNAIMRKWLGVEKPKAFSNNHINDKHKKIDWSIQIFGITVMVVGYFVNVTRLPLKPYFFLETWFLLLVLLFATEIVRAVMERKYAKNPHAYIYTISQLVFLLIFLISLFATDFFGFYNQYNQPLY